MCCKNPPHNVTGRLASVTLPTGGAINYTYTGGSNGISCADGSAATLTRTTPDGTWTYAQVKGTGAASTTTITDPQGNVTQIQFQGIYETQRVAYQGSTSGTLLRTVNTCYNGAASPCTATVITLPITQITVLDQYGSVECKHVYSFNSFGLPTETDDYDYGSGAPGALLRKITTTYATLGNSINGLPKTVTVYNATTQVAQTNYNYDETGVITTSGTPQHTSVSGSRGNLTSVNYPVSGLTRHFTYYDTGTLNTTTDVNGAVTTMNYSSGSCGNSFPTSVSEPLSMLRSMAWNCTGGVLTSLTDENNKVTSTSYNDPNFWRPASVNLPDGGQTSWTYNSPTSITTTTKMNSTQNIVSTTLLDGLGRTSQTQLNSDPQGVNYTVTTYDALGRTYQAYNPTRCNPPTTNCGESTWGKTTFRYDALSRPTSVTEQDGSVASASYSGNTTTLTDEAGKKRQLQFDALGRTSQITEDPGGLGYVTTYGFDALNNLSSVLQNGSRNRTFTYDALSRLTSETNPESGTVTYGYDASGHAGDLTSRTDARNITTTYSYDAIHRLTQKSYSDTTPTTSFIYDTASVDGFTLTNPVGRLVKASTGGSFPTAAYYYYDAMGRVQRLGQCVYINNCGTSAPTLWVETNSYDMMGNLTSYTDANGVTFTQSFDGAARPSQLTSSWVDSTHPASIATADSTLGYYPPGALRKVALGNGLTATTSYNNRLQPCRINVNSTATALSQCTDAVPGGNLLDLNYAYNAGSADNGNLASWSASGQQSFSRSYSYDSFNRLSTLSSPSDPTGCTGLTWTYDAWGNRSDQTVTGGTCNTFHQAMNAKNQIVAGSYDAAGNLLFDGFHSYSYDAENRIQNVDGGNTGLYVYDAAGQRVAKAAGSVTTFYIYGSDGQVVSERDAHNNWIQTYIHFGAQPVALYRNSNSGFLHADHLGTTRLVTLADKSVYDSMDFLPFGEQIAGGSATTHKFTGLERDAESSLDHTQFRQYSSSLGRWMHPDPAGLAAVDPNNPQSWNRYAYVLNNPVNFIDPLGLTVCDANGNNCYDSVTVTAGGGWGGGSGVFGGAGGGGTDSPPSLIFRGGGGGGGNSSSGGVSGRIQCATQFGRDHSLAAGVGAVFGNKVGNNFFTQLFLGNTVSSLAKIGTDVFDGTVPTGSQVASMAIKGAGQGIPGLPRTFNPIVGPIRAAGVGATLSAGYNVIAGVGQETLELGVTGAKVATVVAPLTSTALQTAAAAVAWGKFIFDAGTFTYGAAIACRQ